MLNRFFLIAAILVVGLGAAHAGLVRDGHGSQDQPGASAQPALPVLAGEFDGDWKGKVKKTGGGRECVETIRLNVTISGNDVTGVAKAKGKSYEFTATVDDDGVFSGETLEGAVKVKGTHSGGAITGEWSHEAGCKWKFKITKQG